MRPNAFISLPISNSEVKQKLTELQQKIIANDSSVSSLSVSPATFHLTLMVVNVQHRDLSRAHAALLESAQFISPMLAAIDYKLNLNKLSSFGENVVFVTMSDEQEIAAFKAAAAKIREIFAVHGIPSTDEREAMPHITLFKSVGRNRRRIPYQAFQGLHDTECGDESLTKLELCSMSQPKQDSGYYHVFYEGNLQS